MTRFYLSYLQPHCSSIRLSHNHKREFRRMPSFEQEVVTQSSDQMFGPAKFVRVPVINLSDILEIPKESKDHHSSTHGDDRIKDRRNQSPRT
jgi:hypothetical protein